LLRFCRPYNGIWSLVGSKEVKPFQGLIDMTIQHPDDFTLWYGVRGWGGCVDNRGSHNYPFRDPWCRQPLPIEAQPLPTEAKKKRLNSDLFPHSLLKSLVQKQRDSSKGNQDAKRRWPELFTTNRPTQKKNTHTTRDVRFS